MNSIFEKLIRREKPQPKAGYTQALRIAYHSMKQTFYATDYLNEVRRLSGTRAFDSTILRRLRKMRQDQPETFTWVCIDNKHAMYQKVNQN